LHFEDLSPYTYPSPQSLEQMTKQLLEGEVSLKGPVNVGWLGKGHDFKVGKTTRLFRKKLRKIAENPIHHGMDGFHNCGFCERWKNGASGHGEIRVEGKGDVTYVAPTLIVHYVEDHKYHPPQQFIDAVLASDC
jgi:hypothetical protein